MFQKTEKGFTLIELLVVILIIGILAGFIIFALGGTRAKARDAQRKSDLTQIKKALEVYRLDQNPEAVPSTGGLNTKIAIDGTSDILSVSVKPYIGKKMPTEPVNTQPPYKYASDGKDFNLYATLENAKDPKGNGGAIDGYVVTND